MLGCKHHRPFTPFRVTLSPFRVTITLFRMTITLFRMTIERLSSGKRAGFHWMGFGRQAGMMFHLLVSRTKEDHPCDMVGVKGHAMRKGACHG